jgi:hypothetical protein
MQRGKNTGMEQMQRTLREATNCLEGLNHAWALLHSHLWS